MNITGLIQIYAGDGKGKTTAALGLALRAVGHGLTVSVVQFLKGTGFTGELESARKLAPQLEIRQFGRSCPRAKAINIGREVCDGCGACFVDTASLTEEDHRLAESAWRAFKQAVMSSDVDIVIGDEIASALSLQLVKTEELLALLRDKPTATEVVLTGRDFPTSILEIADLVTEMKLIKHPFEQGIPARRGIEY